MTACVTVSRCKSTSAIPLGSNINVVTPSPVRTCFMAVIWRRKRVSSAMLRRNSDSESITRREGRNRSTSSRIRLESQDNSISEARKEALGFALKVLLGQHLHNGDTVELQSMGSGEGIYLPLGLSHRDKDPGAALPHTF